MLNRHGAGLVLCAWALATPALAQPAGNLVELNIHTPKPGQEAKYEAGRKKHMAWHKAQKDTWTWFTWEVVSGEEGGTYYTGSFGHAWKDFDGHEQFAKDDDADYAKNIGPVLARSFTAYYTRRADLSLIPPSSDPPSAFSVLTYYRLKPEGLNDFVETVKKVNEAIKKTSYPQAGPSAWFQLVNGGEGPLFINAAGRASWAAFAPNDKTLDQLMEEAFGKEQGAAILAAGRKAILSIRTETVKYRADLSYVPPK